MVDVKKRGLSLNIIIFLAVVLFLPCTYCTDGIDCGLCEAIVAQIDDLGELPLEELEKGLEDVCKFFKFIPEFEDRCIDFVDKYLGYLIHLIIKKMNPTKICRDIGLCNECTLECGNGDQKYELSAVIVAVLMAILRKDYVKFKVYPVIDLDFDGFSSVHSGYSTGCEWRGKDCKKFNHKVHPFVSGVSSEDGVGWTKKDTDEDFNCNGIEGTNPETGNSYEEDFCGSYEYDRGLITVGDSVCAGFNILERWLDLDHIMEFFEKGLVSQLSFPEKAMSTGYNPATELEGDVTSLYTYLFKDNRCVHRQYMNLCIGGAMVGDIDYQLSKYKLKKDEVKPSVVYYGLYSNDACRDSYEDMTSLEDFQNSFLSSLDTLESKLRKGSKMLVIGNTDGNLLWETLKDVVHPVSSTSANFTYAQFWDFLTCLDLNMCTMWLNSNETIRQQGIQRSEEYNDFMKSVVEKQGYENFEMRYLDYNQIALRAMENMEKDGIERYLYFNWFDGFHVAQEYGHPYSGQAIGQLLDEQYPGWLGTGNPYNKQIKELFGDQGGY